MIQVSLKSDKNYEYMKTRVRLWYDRAELFLEWETFQTKLWRKSNTF
jgi:hypothetical protein